MKVSRKESTITCRIQDKPGNRVHINMKFISLSGCTIDSKQLQKIYQVQEDKNGWFNRPDETGAVVRITVPESGTARVTLLLSQ